MAKLVAELTIYSKESPRAEYGQVPQPLIDYARALLESTRDSLRFLWRDGERWLSVQAVREVPAAPAGAHGSAVQERVSLRVAEIELPRAITAREVDVLTLLALGLTNAGIAERLGTSARTVSTQIERLLSKLDQGTRGGLAALAVDSGLLRLPIPGGVDGSIGIAIVEVEAIVTSVPRPAQTNIRATYPRKRPILVGTLVPTGAAAADGLEVLNGSRMAVEELNAAGGVAGRPVELVTANVDLFNWPSIERGLNDLFARDVDAVTTSYASAENGRVVDLIADYGSPFLHTATYAEQVELVESDPTRYGGIFQTCASETHYGDGVIRLLSELEGRGLWKPRSRRVVSIEADASSTHVTTQSFISTAAGAGWDIVELIRVPLHFANWNAVVSQLAALDPDVVLVTHFLENEIAKFQRAFTKEGVPALVYYVYGPSIPAFQAAAGEAADGVIWSTTTGTYDDILGQRFRTQYTARFGRQPGWSQAGSAYDQIRLLAAAWSATLSRDTADVVKFLRRWPQRGVNGVYYFGDRSQSTLSYPDVTPDASIGQAHMIYQIQGGTHKALAPSPFGNSTNYRTPSWFQDDQRKAS